MSVCSPGAQRLSLHVQGLLLRLLGPLLLLGEPLQLLLLLARSHGLQHLPRGDDDKDDDDDDEEDDDDV